MIFRGAISLYSILQLLQQNLSAIAAQFNSKAISRSLTFLYKLIYLQNLNLKKQTQQVEVK